MTFQFSESKQEIRNVFIGETPYFVGVDVASALGYAKPHNAISHHCRYALKQGIPHPQNPKKRLEVSVIPESDVYRLIMKSTLPSAQTFEMWVMDEVLPTLRKQGYYGIKKASASDYIDARAIPYEVSEVNGVGVRVIEVNDEKWLSLNDIHRAIGSRTESANTVKKLNAVEPLAVKIWIYGNTQPSWFTNMLGLQLVMSGSRILRHNRQLKIDFNEGRA